LPDGQHFLVGQLFGTDLWDAARREKVGAQFPHTSAVSTIVIDAAGKRAATGAWGVGQVWDLQTRNPIGPPLRHDGARFKGVAFSPDGRVLASLAYNGDTRFWDAATGRPIGPVLGHPGPGNALAFLPDGSALLTGTGDALVRRWRVPRPVTDEPGLLKLRTEVLTGMELDAEGVVRWLAEDVWRERRRRLEELAPGTAAGLGSE
jgi:WD40 repeat protein